MFHPIDPAILERMQFLEQLDARDRLDGLADIPLQEWIAPKPKPKAEDPDSSAEAPKEREELPWDAIEPVPFDAGGRSPKLVGATGTLPTGAAAPHAIIQRAAHPNDATVEGWVKAKAMEVKGPERARPLYATEATRAEVELCYDEQQRVRLMVKDNGRGKSGGDGGFGLLGIQERVKLMGGTLAIQTAPGQGFSLEVEITA